MHRLPIYAGGNVAVNEYWKQISIIMSKLAGVMFNECINFY